MAKQLGRGDTALKNGSHISQRQISRNAFCNSPCPTKAVMEAGEQAVGVLGDKDTRDRIISIFEDLDVLEMMMEGPLTRRDIQTMKVEFKRGDLDSILSDTQIGRILSAQKAGITSQDLLDVSDRLAVDRPTRRDINRAMNAAAVQRRLLGMESTGWSHPRHGSDTVDQYLPTKHKTQRERRAAREYFRSVGLDPDALGV